MNRFILVREHWGKPMRQRIKPDHEKAILSPQHLGGEEDDDSAEQSAAEKKVQQRITNSGHGMHRHCNFDHGNSLKVNSVGG
jgi:hypothetical protein